MKTSKHLVVRMILATALVAGLVIGALSPVAAKRQVVRKTPPGISVVYEGKVLQRARPYKYCWSYPTSKDEMVSMCGDGVPRYPEAATVATGSEVTLRIGYPYKPPQWSLMAYRLAIQEDGEDVPVGPAEEIPFKLKRHRVNGVVKAWDVVFVADEPLRHYYIRTAGQLRQGDAFYALHIRT